MSQIIIEAINNGWLVRTPQEQPGPIDYDKMLEVVKSARDTMHADPLLESLIEKKEPEPPTTIIYRDSSLSFFKTFPEALKYLAEKYAGA